MQLSGGPVEDYSPQCLHIDWHYHTTCFPPSLTLARAQTTALKYGLLTIHAIVLVSLCHRDVAC